METYFDKQRIKLYTKAEDVVNHYAIMKANRKGEKFEVEIPKEFSDEFIILCPAIRPTWSVVNDQIRVVTPADAIKSGVDYMVVGRPITSADDPVTATNMIIDEIEEASKAILI